MPRAADIYCQSGLQACQRIECGGLYARNDSSYVFEQPSTMVGSDKRVRWKTININGVLQEHSE